MRFAIVTLGIAALLAAGLVTGAPAAGAAVVAITVLAYFLDRIAALEAPDRPDAEFPAGGRLSVALGLLHFPLLFGAVWALAATPHHGTADKALIFVAVSLFAGQIGNANAHELIHRPRRAVRRLGTAVYASMLFGHHASAHLRVHHVRAATPDDPNSARLGESVYAFAWRAWTGSFVEGWRTERRLRGTGPHPYLGHAAVSAACLSAAWAIGGAGGLSWFVAIAAYAQAQLLLSDYVQHYGLVRARRADGGWAPIGPEHSWNAANGYSSAMMLNAPRHSDHHARPNRAYPDLRLDRAAMPMLPHSLPVMAVLALVPPLWRRVMDRRVTKARALAPSGPAGTMAQTWAQADGGLAPPAGRGIVAE